jgi:hypothetical protein
MFDPHHFAGSFDVKRLKLDDFTDPQACTVNGQKKGVMFEVLACI